MRRAPARLRRRQGRRHRLGSIVAFIGLQHPGSRPPRSRRKRRENCTAGYWERHDLSQVLDQIRLARPSDTAQMMVFGVSLGAATAAATAALRDDLAAVVLESPPRISGARQCRTWIGSARRESFFRPLLLSMAQQLAKCDFSAVRPFDLIRQIRCPLMIIAPDNDPMVGIHAQEAMEQSLQSRQREREDVYGVSSAETRWPCRLSRKCMSNGCATF